MLIDYEIVKTSSVEVEFTKLFEDFLKFYQDNELDFDSLQQAIGSYSENTDEILELMQQDCDKVLSDIGKTYSVSYIDKLRDIDNQEYPEYSEQRELNFFFNTTIPKLLTEMYYKQGEK